MSLPDDFIDTFNSQEGQKQYIQIALKNQETKELSSDSFKFELTSAGTREMVFKINFDDSAEISQGD